ncbi:MAG TPA: SDR family oxidoreductase [Ignavibacteriales bacterium]|nr:SDR family oxidoreductase [Ignavibacteriales bacterium]HOL81850.1 SDR family oxidoreductase [Ignavibacteriales bacterium]HOM65049.1 SDR family oxidoreductase [Ignavibacteriales bacterium]HPD67219.1 SDR family oxidoreductase [Ignavibacteriales bacterium]HPP34013.1 SDR family oxidoreductase [Ignavibacteriales bacterium]
MTKFMFIVGANSDIAKETVKYFAKDGFNFIFGVRDTKQLDDFVMDIQIKFRINCKVIEFDITKYETHETIWESIKNEVTDVMVAAGYLPQQKLAEKEWSICFNTINVNFTGAISILNLVANTFEERKKGCIIGISSVAGDRGRKDNYIYGSAKAGFTAYLSGLRNRLYKSNVHVITVKPGPVYTKMTSNLQLSNLFTVNPDKVAKDIYKAYKNKQDILYTPGYWYLIMGIFKLIPEFIYKKMSVK